MFDKKTRTILMIVTGILATITVVTCGITLYYMFSGEDVPYFINHFGMAIALICIGIIAFIMPMFGTKKYQDDTKDSIMLIVAGLLVLSGLLSILLSYLGIGF